MPPTSTDPAQPPLRTPVFHVLLALAEGARHGLGIAEAIERTTAGIVELGPGTLYRTLAELVDAGLIEPVEAPSADADPRRKYYAISATGRLVLRDEVERLQRLVADASRRVIPDLA